MWDYLNRMLASGYNNSTTTYAYDPSGTRVLQTSTTSTTYYPSKYYSFTATKSRCKYVRDLHQLHLERRYSLSHHRPAASQWCSDRLPITRYIHPDHLGSTNAVTDQASTDPLSSMSFPNSTTSRKIGKNCARNCVALPIKVCVQCARSGSWPAAAAASAAAGASTRMLQPR